MKKLPTKTGERRRDKPGSRPKPSGKLADLRWGCIFFDKMGKRIGSIFFDRKGLNGVIEGCCVRFASDGLRKWAEEHFGNAFR